MLIRGGFISTISVVRTHYYYKFFILQNEREQYEVVINNGKIVYKQNQQPVDTPEGSKWIFVMSTSHNLYVGQVFSTFKDILHDCDSIQNISGFLRHP